MARRRAPPVADPPLEPPVEPPAIAPPIGHRSTMSRPSAEASGEAKAASLTVIQQQPVERPGSERLFRASLFRAASNSSAG